MCNVQAMMYKKSYTSSSIVLMSKPKPGAGSLKDLEVRRREVFKPILDNPYTKGYEWPETDSETSKTITEYLTQLLSGYGKYLEVQKTGDKTKVERPEICDKLTLGFNSTVKKLEDQAAPNREKLFGEKQRKRRKVQKQNKSAGSESYVKYVFVTKSDISTPLLTNSFPLLTFCASRTLEDRVKLVELPRGSMAKLLKVLNTPNVGVLSLAEDWKEGKAMFDLINSRVRDVDVPWLLSMFDDNPNLGFGYEKPMIRFLKTSAPIGKGRPKQKKGKAGREEQDRRKQAKEEKRE